jgi:hypothetical protein
MCPKRYARRSFVLARFIYKWKPTEHGRRLFRSPGTAPAKASVTAAVEPAAPDYGSLKKDELIEAAEKRDLDPSGTKAEIIERLEADDVD